VSAADWYAKRIANGAPAPRPQRSTPPTGMAGPPQQQTFQPYQQHPATYEQPQQGQRQYESLSDAMSDPNLRSAGGDGAKAQEIYSCPNCGSKDFFTRRTMGGAMGKPPAPHCMSCGYNGMYEQFGAQLSEDR
jgi:predicted nucleic-acid-binding Zn-ribbon protein